MFFESFIFRAPNSGVAFSVFNYDIRYYGIMLFLGMLTGILTTCFISKKYYKTVDLDLLTDFFPFLIVFSILCARLYYVLLSLDYYLKYKGEIFAIWHGGIAIHGAILGGILAGIIFFKVIKKIPILPYADVVSYGLAVGQAIGRWGNFFNQEAFGRACDLPWKLYIEPAKRPIEYAFQDFFHPTFLYESLWDIFVFLMLFFMVRKLASKFLAKPDGIVFFSYLALYSLGRIFIENLRIDSVLNIFGVPFALLVSVLTLFVSFVALILLILKNKKPANT